MTGEDEEQKKDSSKGFAGLSSLVSAVDTTPPPTGEVETDLRGGRSSATHNTQSQTSQQRPTHQQTASQPSSGSSGGMWVLGVAVVIGVLWLISVLNRGTTTQAPAHSPPTSSYSPSEPSRPVESKPPIGQELIFSSAQIRYCLAEDIRMESAKSALNNYIDSDVDRFNAMVNDFNSRCGSFRYRAGALESARREIEPYRSQLQHEGASRFSRSPSADASSMPAPVRPGPDATVLAIQRRLNELGYEAGAPDGLMGRATRSAILNFQRDAQLVQDGLPSRDLLASLNSSTPLTRENRRAERSAPPVSASSAAIPTNAAQGIAPARQIASLPSSRDVENFKTCVSGQYPSLCNHALLTPDEKAQVAQAERRVNFDTCISGNYPSLCKRDLLTADEAARVADAERRVNFQTCISGNYPSLCKRDLLTADEAARVADAERRVNFQTCISGNYPSLCKHSLLTPDEAERVAEAERRMRGR